MAGNIPNRPKETQDRIAIAIVASLYHDVYVSGMLDAATEEIQEIAPNASINIIRDYKVIEKHPVDLPVEIVGVVRCQNPNCISNTLEPIKSRMLVKAKNPVLLRCLFCEQPLTERIAEYLI